MKVLSPASPLYILYIYRDFTRTRKNSRGIIKDYTVAMEVSQDSKDWFIINLIKEFFKVGKYTLKRGVLLDID